MIVAQDQDGRQVRRPDHDLPVHLPGRAVCHGGRAPQTRSLGCSLQGPYPVCHPAVTISVGSWGGGGKTKLTVSTLRPKMGWGGGGGGKKKREREEEEKEKKAAVSTFSPVGSLSSLKWLEDACVLVYSTGIVLN